MLLNDDGRRWEILMDLEGNCKTGVAFGVGSERSET
jgi:hypothetical protein